MIKGEGFGSLYKVRIQLAQGSAGQGARTMIKEEGFGSCIRITKRRGKVLWSFLHLKRLWLSFDGNSFFSSIPKIRRAKYFVDIAVGASLVRFIKGKGYISGCFEYSYLFRYIAHGNERPKAFE